jgi:phosphate starvation-inducible PhoH-like protein
MYFFHLFLFLFIEINPYIPFGIASFPTAIHAHQIGKMNQLRCKNIRLYATARKKNVGNSCLYVPKTENQQKYVEFLSDPMFHVVVGLGPAGCGKTLFACNNAVEKLKSGAVDKIVITRPLVSVEEEELGFLPGSMLHKMDPWTRPIFDILEEFYSKTQIQNMIREGIIEICPLAYMRGRTFKRSYIIADEMQNSSPSQILMLMTRIGDGTKLTITGDPNQSDRKIRNGLEDFLSRMESYGHENTEHVKIVYMNQTDVQRSVVVQEILKIYDEKKVVAQLNTTASVAAPASSAAYNKQIWLSLHYNHPNISPNDDAALIPLQYERNLPPQPPRKK